MPAVSDTRRPGPLRRQALFIAAGLVLVAVYFGYLTWQNARMAQYFETLRTADPVRYLDDLRKNEGFESYLEKYRLLEGYFAFKAEAPVFLLGRWSLRDGPERMAPGTVFADCTDPIAFEEGVVRLGQGDSGSRFDARYRIVNSDVYVRLDQGGMMRVEMVIYGNSIDHLELVPPGRQDRLYAYYCGN